MTFIKLKALCEFEKGTTGLAKAEPGNYPLVTTSAERKSCNTYQFDTRAVCIPLVSSTGHGHASLRNVHYQEGKFALGSILVALTSKNDNRLDIQFLHLYLSQLKDQILVPLMSGAANVALSIKKIQNIEIPLPSIERQHEIVKRFKSVIIEEDELKSELAHQQTLLKKLRQQILQEAIEGKLTADWRAQNPDVDPASELLKRIAAEKAQLIKDKKIKAQKSLPPITDEEKPFELPQGWVWCRLGRITNIVRGGSPRPAGDSRFYNGDIPFLKVADLTSDSAMRLNNYTYTIKQAGLHKTRKVPAETLMLTNSGATLGIPKICMFDTTFNDGIAAFIFIHSELFKPFFYYVLLSKTSWFLKETSRGQGQPNLNIDIIGNTVIYLPSFYEQQAIVIKVEKLLAFCDQLEAQITQNQAHAEQLMQTVLKEAFSHNRKIEPISITPQASTHLPDAMV